MKATLKYLRPAIPVVAGLILSVVSGFGAVITVSNFSFETPVTFTGSCGSGCSYSADNIVPSWTVVPGSGVTGILQPGTGQFVSVPDGVDVAFTNGGTISQTVSATVQANTVYTLLVDVGLRTDLQGSLGFVELVINGNTYTGTGVAPTAGHFSTYAVNYTAQNADLGKAITITLGATSPQGEFDNVRLTSNIAGVPEPTTLGLFGLGMLGLGFISRRKRA